MWYAIAMRPLDFENLRLPEGVSAIVRWKAGSKGHHGQTPVQIRRVVYGIQYGRKIRRVGTIAE